MYLTFSDTTSRSSDLLLRCLGLIGLRRVWHLNNYCVRSTTEDTLERRRQGAMVDPSFPPKDSGSHEPNETTGQAGNTPHENGENHDHHQRKAARTSEQPTSIIIDPEKAKSIRSIDEEDHSSHAVSTFYRRFRTYFHCLIWLFFTGLVRHLRKPPTYGALCSDLKALNRERIVLHC